MTPQNAASHLGLFCLLTCFSSKNEIKIKFTPYAPKNENGLIQMIKMGKSIRHKWIKRVERADCPAIDYVSFCFSVRRRFPLPLGTGCQLTEAHLDPILTIRSICIALKERRGYSVSDEGTQNQKNSIFVLIVPVRRQCFIFTLFVLLTLTRRSYAICRLVRNLLYKQIVGIPMGTSYASLVADLFFYFAVNEIS